MNLRLDREGREMGGWMGAMARWSATVCLPKEVGGGEQTGLPAEGAFQGLAIYLGEQVTLGPF